MSQGEGYCYHCKVALFWDTQCERDPECDNCGKLVCYDCLTEADNDIPQMPCRYLCVDCIGRMEE